MSSPKQIVSLSKDPKNKENNSEKENNREAYKTTEKKMEVSKTNIKSIKMVKPKPINQRQSFHHGKSYQFNPRASTSSFDSSQESLSLDEIKFSQQASQMAFYGGRGRQKLDLIDEDCLCEGTPDKIKKAKKWFVFFQQKLSKVKWFIWKFRVFLSEFAFSLKTMKI